jgi:hypothetical protein
MSWAHRNIFVPADLAPLARMLAAGLSPAGAGMLVVGASPTTAGPATYFISSGPIQPQFAAAIADPALLYEAAVAAGVMVTFEDCVELVSRSDVSTDAPRDALARLGLVLVDVEAHE